MERLVSAFGDHCYILATDRNGQFLQVSAGATNDRSTSTAWAGSASQGKEQQYKRNQCIKCDANQDPVEVGCEKVDCLKKMAKVYNDKKYGYDPVAEKAPNSNSFVGWIMKICGMPVDPNRWSAHAVGCFYWTGDESDFPLTEPWPAE